MCSHLPKDITSVLLCERCGFVVMLKRRTNELNRKNKLTNGNRTKNKWHTKELSDHVLVVLLSVSRGY